MTLSPVLGWNFNLLMQSDQAEISFYYGTKPTNLK